MSWCRVAFRSYISTSLRTESRRILALHKRLNQHAVISTSPANFFSNPLILTFLTPKDDFAGRSHSRFGVGEEIRLDFSPSHRAPPEILAVWFGVRLRVVGTCAGLQIGALQFTRRPRPTRSSSISAFPRESMPAGSFGLARLR